MYTCIDMFANSALLCTVHLYTQLMSVCNFLFRPSALSPQQFDELSLRCGRVLTEAIDVSNKLYPFKYT